MKTDINLLIGQILMTFFHVKFSFHLKRRAYESRRNIGLCRGATIGLD